MKLIIKQGESVDNALKYLQDFLGQYKEEYPMLKGNMNIYVTLEGFGHRVCPENERELVLTGEDILDLEQKEKDKALKAVMSRWRQVLEQNALEIRNVQRKLRLDKEYLSTAEEKGKRPDLIAKREKEKTGHEGEMDKHTQRYLLLNRFNKALEDGKAVFYYVKHTRGKSAYTYTMECILVFDNIDGLYGYCDRYGFKTGLPYGYKEI